MNPLQFRVISEAEVDHFERAPHNPPSATDEKFSDEWWAVRAALKQRLGLLGDEWRLATGSGDFMLAESHGRLRWVYVTFTSTRLWRPEFVTAVAHLLAGLPHDYRVGCVTELGDEEMFEHPVVFLVISSTAVFGHVDDPASDALSRLGFPLHIRPDAP